MAKRTERLKNSVEDEPSSQVSSEQTTVYFFINITLCEMCYGVNNIAVLHSKKIDSSCGSQK